ncbi:MAG: alanine--tRNA ligase [Deltaproteobacteria bacterium]
MTGSEIRQTFLKYFESNGHSPVKSSSLIPRNDPTLLFTNAGMVQFKDVFLGLDNRPYRRATTCQKCVRAGGKHNDLENVGYTARHHTFFEMLGNFSFGDYFKRDAIKFGWELMAQVYKLPVERLWVTVFRDDDEAYEIWRKEIGISPSRLVRMGEKDNFWAMGDTGPCGPCSEILIDQGESFSCGSPGCAFGCDCDRYLELWNLVFMQYERDASGTLTPLPRPSIDTGMGLERVTAVLQGARSNYETDLLRGIISKVEEIAARPYGERADTDVSMRVIADHARAVTFLISDGVIPSNDGRGYVLRRILRRAVRHARMLGIKDSCLHKLAPRVNEIMGGNYAEIGERLEFVADVIRNEEERFFDTIDRGLELLGAEIQKHSEEKILPGEVAFKLYDTFGFPLDLTQDISRERGFALDSAGFEAQMERQQERSRQSWKGAGDDALAPLLREFAAGGLASLFTGYGRTEDEGRITAIIKGGTLLDSASEGDRVEIICDRTPFYGESGGQTGDRGVVEAESGSADVLDTKKPLQNLIVHYALIKSGSLWVGDKVNLRVDPRLRGGTETHHSATHILHAVLRETLGSHVRQGGSLVAPERMRFDFSHFAPIEDNTLRRMEEVINERVRRDDRVITAADVPYNDAVKSGAMAIFEEKYGDKVRVVSIGDYSRELCGGTHIESTGEAGLFKITAEGASAAGVRRIEAVAGEAAWRFMRRREDILGEAAAFLRAPESELVSRLKKLAEENERLRGEIDKFKEQGIRESAKSIMDGVKSVGGMNVLSAQIPGAGADELRRAWDSLKAGLCPGVAALGGSNEGRAYLLVGVTKELVGRFHAGNIVKEIAPIIGGGGGGKPDLAQAGGGKPEKLAEAVDMIFEIVKRAAA